MTELLDSLWIEKYRPKKLDDLVLEETAFKDFTKVISTNKLPNLLFAGPPGGGKTTLGRILCSPEGVLSNPKDNLLLVNGSAKRTRGIGFVDEVIEPFLKHPPISDQYKVVFIDEADKLTNDGFDSLRAIIEKYQVHYGRFLFTCNYLSKIPDPIQSRFTVYTFARLPKDFIFDYCKKILTDENVTYKDQDINLVINNLYPDVRKIVNVLQRCSSNGKLRVKSDEITTTERQILTYIHEVISNIEKQQDQKIGSSISAIVNLLSQQEPEYRNIYTDLFYDNKVPVPAKVVVNQYANTHQNALVPSMHLMAMVFDIIKSLTEYRKALVGK